MPDTVKTLKGKVMNEDWHLTRGVSVAVIVGLILQLVLGVVFIIRLEGAIMRNGDHIATNAAGVVDIRGDIEAIESDLQDRDLTLVRVSVQLENLTTSVSTLTGLVAKIDDRFDEAQQKEVVK